MRLLMDNRKVADLTYCYLMQRGQHPGKELERPSNMRNAILQNGSRIMINIMMSMFAQNGSQARIFGAISMMDAVEWLKADSQVFYCLLMLLRV